MSLHKTIVIAVAPILALSACVPQPLIDTTRSAISTASASNQRALDSMNDQINNSKDFYERSQEVNKPFLAGRAVPLARDVTLPQALKKGVKTLFITNDGKVTLQEAAQKILLATGIAVTIAPDVYLSNTDLLPKKKGQSDQTSGANLQTNVPVTGAPTRTTLTTNTPIPVPFGDSSFSGRVSASGTGASLEIGPMVELPRNQEAPLAQILDMIAARLGIQWQYDDVGNNIKFYRLVTRSWQVPVGSHKNDFSTKIEGGTSDTTNTNSLSQKNQQVPIGSTQEGQNELQSIADSIETVMTRSGQSSVASGSGVITLTDTKDAVEAADKLIKMQIRILSRLVILRVRTVQVTSSDGGESGVNWNAVLTKALSNVPGFSLTSSSPASLVDSNAGTIGLNVLNGSGQGTQAIVSALRSIGDVQASTEVPLSSRNRHAIYYNVRNTFSYVSQTTPATATAGGTGGVPGITTSQNQVGTKLVLYPNATSKDNVMLTVAFDQSVLKSLDKFTSGSGSNSQTVQLPNVDGQGSSQEVPVRDGQTLVLTGFDRRTNEYDKRTLGDGWPILTGGSHKASQERTTTIVLVSVVVKDIDN